jgi:membrane-associated phospholipid phosphatase
VQVPPDGPAVLSRSAAPRAVVAATACLVVVVLLGVGVETGFGPQLRVDASVSEALSAGDGRVAALDWLLEVVTAPGVTWVRLLVFLPVLVLLVRRRAWVTTGWLLTAVVLIAPLTTALKELVGRIRPPFADGGARYDSLSYPSGHAAGIATLVTVALVLLWPVLSVSARRWALLAGVVLVVVVGLSRMWLGVHYLSDVLGGWSLGIAWTLGTALLFGVLPGGRTALREVLP